MTKPDVTNETNEESVAALDARHVWHPFTQAATAPPPVEIVRGRGATLTTADGRELLDLVSSWWVNLHGHAHPAIAEAVARQARELEHVIFAGFTHAPAARLAHRLTRLLPPNLSRVFFSDDGSTAVEVALKLAVQVWRNRGAPRTRFLVFEGGYHGDTVGAMSAGVSSGFFGAFEDLLFRVETVPFPATWEGDGAVAAKERAALAALESALGGAPVAAVVVEPLVQGAAGMRMCRPEFLREAAARVREAGALLVFDEVMTGFGRTGAMFACQRAGVAPDLVCLSKGLTGGFLPLAVTVCGEAVYEAFLGAGFDRAFVHGHSYTANPLGCAAALASLEVFEAENTLARVAEIEALHRRKVMELAAAAPRVVRPRVTGSIAAFDLAVDDPGYAAAVGPELRRRFLEAGLLLRPLGNTVYLMPPYCITDAELEGAWNIVREVIGESRSRA